MLLLDVVITAVVCFLLQPSERPSSVKCVAEKESQESEQQLDASINKMRYMLADIRATNTLISDLVIDQKLQRMPISSYARSECDSSTVLPNFCGLADDSSVDFPDFFDDNASVSSAESFTPESILCGLQ
jgi:hypothetical protein